MAVRLTPTGWVEILDTFYKFNYFFRKLLCVQLRGGGGVFARNCKKIPPLSDREKHREELLGFHPSLKIHFFVRFGFDTEEIFLVVV